MANEGSTKPTYSELEAENLRVRGLLQRGIECARIVVDAETMRYVGTPLTVDEHILELDEWLSEAQSNFPQSSSLVPQGAESADIGKIDAADKSGSTNCTTCGKQILAASTAVASGMMPRLHEYFCNCMKAAGMEMGKVNRVDGGKA